MSNLDLKPAIRQCGGREGVTASPVRDLITGRTVPLGESTRVRRLLPTLGRRMVGAWCFVDHYGPDNIAEEPGMQVPPHPHIGLQTVSWLREGEILHRDSLGSRQLLSPGTLGLMTSGRGISHAEQSPATHPADLHGAQLWVALPDADRAVAPDWSFHSELPAVAGQGVTATVIMGEFDGAASPGKCYSPLVGAQLEIGTTADAALPVEPDFEYAALAMSGSIEVDGVAVEPGSLLYLGCGRSQLSVQADNPGSLLLLGGEPFDEKIVMWWNFVARTGDEVTRAREEWASGEAFGEVRGYDGDPLPAPDLPPLPLKPRGRER